jgi:transcriptional regulator with XRE-family HTH domain
MSPTTSIRMPSPDFYKKVGNSIRKARDKAGLTQDALALRVGLTRTSITNIEKGRQKLLLHTFCNLANALGIPPIELLPDLTVTSEASELEKLLKGRSRKERDWIKSALSSGTKGT